MNRKMASGSSDDSDPMKRFNEKTDKHGDEILSFSNPVAYLKKWLKKRSKKDGKNNRVD